MAVSWRITLSATNLVRSWHLRGRAVGVHGASSGVGTAVELAKHFGAQVTGVCSANNLELVRGLGADHVLDHTRQSAPPDGVRYDLVALDTVGKRKTSALRTACERALQPGGRVSRVESRGGRSRGHRRPPARCGPRSGVAVPARAATFGCSAGWPQSLRVPSRFRPSSCCLCRSPQGSFPSSPSRPSCRPRGFRGRWAVARADRCGGSERCRGW